MSLQTRLSALITAVGADIKALQARTPTILSRAISLSNTSEPANAVEWWTGGSLVGKLVLLNPLVTGVIVNRSELWARVRSRDATSTQDLLLLDSDGISHFARAWGPWTALPFATNWGNYGSGEQNGQYRKTLDGKQVQIRGLVKVSATITFGGTNATIATLPAGSRPPTSWYARIYMQTAGGTSTMVTLGIASTGAMVLYNDLTGRTPAMASGTYVGLDAIEFSTEA